MDILIQKKGKQWYTVIPQNDSARQFLKNETGAVPFLWKGGNFIFKEAKSDSISFIDYLMNSKFSVSLED